MKCSVEGCDLQDHKIGLCSKHYYRLRTKGTFDDPPKFCCEICNIGCGPSGLCSKHYKQRWYLKQQGRTELIVRTSKERWINKYTGYVMVKQDGRLTYEHIVLAEKALGKKLPSGAIVHHMNEDRSDNHSPFNLVICPDQEYHMLLHKRMKELGYGKNNPDS